MQYLREKLKEDLGITDEQYDELVRLAREESTVKNDMDNMGEISAVQVQMLNDMGGMVADLMMRVMMLEVKSK